MVCDVGVVISIAVAGPVSTDERPGDVAVLRVAGRIAEAER